MIRGVVVQGVEGDPLVGVEAEEVRVASDGHGRGLGGVGRLLGLAVRQAEGGHDGKVGIAAAANIFKRGIKKEWFDVRMCYLWLGIRGPFPRSTP